jgi:hypothetical protein
MAAKGNRCIDEAGLRAFPNLSAGRLLLCSGSVRKLKSRSQVTEVVRLRRMQSQELDFERAATDGNDSLLEMWPPGYPAISDPSI